MILNTFSVFNGIGQKLEKKLWREGVLTWNHFLDREDLPFINPARKRLLDFSVSSAYSHLAEGDADYFSDAIKKNEHWRLYDTFRHDAVCLDIETNGFPPDRGGYVTAVGLYNGSDYKCFIRGNNLSADILNRELSQYKYLITFYGTVFDVPFLQSCMRGLNLHMPHFDLCFGAKRLGLKGGLKKIEPHFGIQRNEEVLGMDGYSAVLLWNEARKGNSRSLELLMLYNREDTVNLYDMSGIIYKELKASTGIEEFIGEYAVTM
jgi:uncharacterized protein YprB with RNaseH-like and TPR domain